MYVEVTQEHIAIYKTHGRNMTEVVSWHKDEWIEDPENVVPAIANAINMALTQPKELEDTLSIIKPRP
jgi:hypothetical protein